MSKVWFPLKSNAAWFASNDTRAALERRVKNHLVLYDTLVFETGRYSYVAGEHSASAMYYPDGGPGDRTKISYFQPGEQFALFVGPDGEEPQPVAGGEALVRYQVDFYPILHDAGVLHHDSVQWVKAELSPEERRAVDSALFRERRDHELQATLPNAPSFLRDHVLKSLYHDAAIAHATGVAVAVDELAAPVVRWRARREEARWREDAGPHVLAEWVDIAVPDFGAMPWDELMAKRESGAGREFRQVVERVASEVAEAAPAGASVHELRELGRKRVNAELIEALLERKANPMEAAFNLMLNAFTFGWVAGSLNDLRKLVAERGSWVSLVTRGRPGAT